MNLESTNTSQFPQIPKLIHFTIPNIIDPDTDRRIQRARELHPAWDVRIWRDPLDPKMFRLGHLWKTARSGAQLADLIRIEVVYQFGGFYFDADFDFHRSLEPLRNHSFIIASEDGESPTNAFFGATPGHPALEELILHLEPFATLPKQISISLSTGPEFFARVLRWRDDITIIPRELIYPYSWNEAPKPASSSAFATHLWHGSWVNAKYLERCHHGTRKDRITQSLYRRLRAALLRSLDRIVLRLRSRYRYQNSAYSTAGDLLIRTAHGHDIVASGADLSITPNLALTGYHERNDELFVKRNVRGGDWCVDVGANIGVFSLLFGARVGPFGRVFAFEPNPRAVKYIEKSAVRNWMHDRLRIEELAVGAEPGTGQITFSKERLGDGAIEDRSPTQKRSHMYAKLATETCEVAQTTLDSFFPDWAVFSCIKIDVEGQEADVLKGSRRLFEEHRVNCLIIELLPEHGLVHFTSLMNELRHIVSLGYRCGVASPEGDFKPVTFDMLIWSPHSRNYIFLRPEPSYAPAGPSGYKS